MLQPVEQAVDFEPAVEDRDITGGPSTERMKKLRELYMSHAHPARRPGLVRFSRPVNNPVGIASNHPGPDE